MQEKLVVLLNVIPANVRENNENESFCCDNIASISFNEGRFDIMNHFPSSIKDKTIHLLHVPMHPLPLEYVQARQKVQYHHVQSNLPKGSFIV